MDRAEVKETGRYKVYLNKSDKHVVVLRFPDRKRDQSLRNLSDSKPLEIRIKPKSGLIEVDIPLPDQAHVNRQRAVEIGINVNKHKSATNGAPVGLAGGFGAGTLRSMRGSLGDERDEHLLADFDNSMHLGRAMNHLTLSGQIKQFAVTDPTYYLGNFGNEELHLTKISTFCTLAPGLQHLDAMDANDRAIKRAVAEEESPEEKATVVAMQVKSADEGKTEESEWKRMLREVQEEPWQRLDWVDEDETEAYTMFADKLFVNENDKGNVIRAVMTRQQYLDSISAPRLDPARQGQRVLGDGTLADGGYVDESTDAEDQEEDVQEMTRVSGQ